MSVMIVPAVSPPIIVIDIELYIGSLTRGIIPTIVVSEAISTGRTRDTVAWITAGEGVALSWGWCGFL